MKEVAGIILAGGRSSRMGRNKALLLFQGVPLVEHMRKKLTEAGIADTYISGTLTGYESVPDKEPQAGPARAAACLLDHFFGRYERLFFIPVDMPFVSRSTIRRILSKKGNIFIKDHPLPACLETRPAILKAHSIKGLLDEVSAAPIEALKGRKKDFMNLNTPKEWDNAVNLTRTRGERI